MEKKVEIAMNKLNEYQRITESIKQAVEKTIEKQRSMLCEEIASKFGRMRDLYKVVNRLAELKIPNGELITNGITHEIGFFAKRCVNGRLMCDKSGSYEPEYYLGIEGGGCCGFDLIIDPFKQEIDYQLNEFGKDFYEKLYKFANGFDAYEKKVYDFVDKL